MVGGVTDGAVVEPAAAVAAAVSIAQETSEQAVLRRAVAVGCSVVGARSGSGQLTGPDGGAAVTAGGPEDTASAVPDQERPSVIVPVAAGQQVLGHLVFARAPGMRRFTAGHRLMAESLGRQAGAVIARMRAQRAADAVLVALGPTDARADDPPSLAGETSPTIRRCWAPPARWSAWT